MASSTQYYLQFPAFPYKKFEGIHRFEYCEFDNGLGAQNFMQTNSILLVVIYNLHSVKYHKSMHIDGICHKHMCIIDFVINYVYKYI